MLQTRSNIFLVAQVNTVAGGDIVQISNSAGWVVSVANTSPLVSIQNSAGWVVSIANTVAGGDLVSINNSAGWVVSASSTILNSAGWIVGISNTANWVVNASSTILNSAGWVVGVSNTAGWSVAVSNTLPGWDVKVGSTSIVNSAGWVVSVANTAGWLVGVGSVSIVNSAGWIVSLATTAGVSTVVQSAALITTSRTAVILNSGGLFAMQSGAWNVGITNTLPGWQVKMDSTSIVNSAGWIVSQSNTDGMTVNVINSAGWVFAQSNTANQTVAVLNSSSFVTTYDTSRMYDGTTQLTMAYSSLTVSNSGNTVVINAQTDKRIRVMSVFLMSYNTTSLIWQSGSSTSLNLTGSTYLATNVGYVLPFHPNGWFQTQTSTLLNINLSSPTSIGGCITYLITS